MAWKRIGFESVESRKLHLAQKSKIRWLWWQECMKGKKITDNPDLLCLQQKTGGPLRVAGYWRKQCGMIVPPGWWAGGDSSSCGGGCRALLCRSFLARVRGKCAPPEAIHDSPLTGESGNSGDLFLWILFLLKYMSKEQEIWGKAY
jgi:hypothetical protein